MKKRFHFVTAVFAAWLSIGMLATVGAADKLEGIPLVWKPTSPMSARVPPVGLQGFEGIKLQIDAFTDRRKDPGLIGSDMNSVPHRKVSTNDDVARFVTYQVKLLMAGVGIKVVESGGDVVMKADIRNFFAEEGNRYSADVELQATFSDASGKFLWGVSTSGTSSRFGKAYKADNYHEVLSDALIGAIHQMVLNSGFHKVMAGK